MNIDYNFFKVTDGQTLAYKRWNKVENPKEVIILVHGMAEHIERYDGLATLLNSEGYLVYGADQRGHGKTLGPKGYFTPKNGYKRVIQDQEEFFTFVKKENANLPISYIAHSMGSYVLRNLLSITDLDINRVILSGTGFEPRLKTTFGILLAKLVTGIKGKTTAANLLDSFTNEPLSASVENPVTKFDWLSRDGYEVSKYVNDTNCGFICTNQFYCDLFKLIHNSCSIKSIKKISSSIPILLYSGENDPVGGESVTNVHKLEGIYKKCGLNVQIIINPGGRHENINEINRDEVFNHFIEFLK